MVYFLDFLRREVFLEADFFAFLRGDLRAVLRAVFLFAVLRFAVLRFAVLRFAVLRLAVLRLAAFLFAGRLEAAFLRVALFFLRAGLFFFVISISASDSTGVFLALRFFAGIITSAFLLFIFLNHQNTNYKINFYYFLYRKIVITKNCPYSYLQRQFTISFFLHYFWH